MLAHSDIINVLMYWKQIGITNDNIVVSLFFIISYCFDPVEPPSATILVVVDVPNNIICQSFN